MEAGVRILTVLSGGPGREPVKVTLHSDLSVREALDGTALRVRAACGGTGSCGVCVVEHLEGLVNPPTRTEQGKLGPGELSRGLRLACQLRLQTDATIRIEDSAPQSPWRSIPAEALLPARGQLVDLTSSVYGVAVDLGTTHLRVALWDRRRGHRIASRFGPNPQAAFGSDVLNRLTAASQPDRARALTQLVQGAVVTAVEDMLARDVGEVATMLPEIGQIVIVGNTAMLALLTGRGGQLLLDPERWQIPVEVWPPEDPLWRSRWRSPNAEITVLPAVSGFVGSDLLADLAATWLASGPVPALLLDIGTNTEVALWDGREVRVTSVPGGPAFEEGAFSSGLQAEEGAIRSVTKQADGRFQLDVIGGGEARGYCGSGLIDGIAALVSSGALRASGRFAAASEAGGVLLDPANPRTMIATAAVDAFQRAKAAIAAAISVLLAGAGLRSNELGRVCVCGAFGRELDVANAQALGLLPPVDPSVIELYANASLGGCERIMLSPEPAAVAKQLATKVEQVNLALVATYEKAFVEQLWLRPSTRV